MSDALVPARTVWDAVQAIRNTVRADTPEWFALNRVLRTLGELPTQAEPPKPAESRLTGGQRHVMAKLQRERDEAAGTVNAARLRARALVAAKSDHAWSNDELGALTALCRVLGVEIEG